LAYLPVSIFEGGFECSLNFGRIKGGQSQHCTSADCGFVLARTQDGGKAGLVTDCSEGRDCGFANQRIIVMKDESG
jgi:hypothetical protein